MKLGTVTNMITDSTAALKSANLVRIPDLVCTQSLLFLVVLTKLCKALLWNEGLCVLVVVHIIR